MQRSDLAASCLVKITAWLTSAVCEDTGSVTAPVDGLHDKRISLLLLILPDLWPYLRTPIGILKNMGEHHLAGLFYVRHYSRRTPLALSLLARICGGDPKPMSGESLR